MLTPLIKLVLTHLDTAVAWYLERQRMVIQFVIPGTLLFILLFFAFSGAGVATLGLFLLVAVLETGLAAGLYLLQQRYQDYVRFRHDAADAMEASLFKSDVFGEWETFLTTPCEEDPELERIRLHCQRLPQQHPPASPDSYCGPDGDKVLEAYIQHLRTGIATKFAQDLSVWWALRREKRQERKASQRAAAGQAGSATAAEGSELLTEGHRRQVEKEAAREARRAARELRREDRKAGKLARKATKRAIKAEKQIPAALTEPVASPGPSPMAAQAPQPAPMPAAPVAQAPVQPLPPMQGQAPVQAPPSVQPPAAPVPMQAPMPPQATEPPQMPLPTHAPALSEPPPVEPTDPGPPPGGLTEAAAIEQAVQLGFSAHHFDRAQQALALEIGREPNPAEVLKRLVKEQKKQQKRQKRKPRAARAARTPAPRKRRATRGKPRQIPLATMRRGGDDFFSENVKVHRRRGGARALFRFVVLLALVGGAPFMLWRVPRPETKPHFIIGQVDHQIIDHAPDWKHQLRTPFEELFGNRAVTLEDGTRIYVSEGDYARCWPESWGAMYEKGYKIRVTAEVQELLLGGMTVASITNAERVGVSRPMAAVGDDEP